MTRALLIVAAVIVGLWLLIRFITRRAVREMLQSDAFQRELLQRARAADATDDQAQPTLILDAAPWFGNTGLSDALERELPRYLRRELGQTENDAAALRAQDLVYLGGFAEGPSKVHYWRMPGPHSDPQRHVYAYVQIDPDGQSITGWGDREPPAGRRLNPPADMP